jgi:branched-chain amino acid transport system substrate-binding protein
MQQIAYGRSQRQIAAQSWCCIADAPDRLGHGGSNDRGHIFSPSPTDPEFLEWKRWMEKWNPTASTADYLNVYAYAISATLVEVPKRCGNDLTRANIMKQASNLRGLRVPMLLPGITINPSPVDFYPIQAFRLARFEGEAWELFGDAVSNESS